MVLADEAPSIFDDEPEPVVEEQVVEEVDEEEVVMEEEEVVEEEVVEEEEVVDPLDPNCALAPPQPCLYPTRPPLRLIAESHHFCLRFAAVAL